MATLETIRLINKNFVIRCQFDDQPKSFLKAAGKYHELIGDDELADKHFKKALESPEHKIHFKLRRGLKIIFCSK